jgi:hypothetical protein
MEVQVESWLAQCSSLWPRSTSGLEDAIGHVKRNAELPEDVAKEHADLILQFGRHWSEQVEVGKELLSYLKRREYLAKKKYKHMQRLFTDIQHRIATDTPHEILSLILHSK